jgi:hypothetical protein
MEFKKLTDELPTANTFVLIQRQNGSLYLGYRMDKALSTNPDASRECHWYGRPANENDVNKSTSFFYTNFSDVTVTGWLSIPSLISMANRPLTGIEVL